MKIYWQFRRKKLAGPGLTEFPEESFPLLVKSIERCSINEGGPLVLLFTDP